MKYRFTLCCLQKFVCQTVDEAERREEKERVTREERKGGEKAEKSERKTGKREGKGSGRKAQRRHNFTCL